MGRRPRVDRTPEEKWQIVQEQERERVGDVSASRDRCESVLSLEG